MNMDDCFAIDTLVWVLKARRGWQQGPRPLSHILRRGRPRRGNAHHDRGRHNKPRPAAVTGTIPIERILQRRRTKQSDEAEGNRLRTDILFRNLDEEFDGTSIQFLHRRTSPSSVELAFFHSEGMASLIGVGLRFAVVELVAAGDSTAGLDVNRVIVRECSEQWWKELWMDNTSTRHGGYTSLLVQLKGHRGPADFGGRVAIAETGWSSPGSISASGIALNPSPQCGSIRDLLACILRHGATSDPEQGSINLGHHAQQPTEGAAPDGDEAADTAAAAGTVHGGSSTSQQQCRSISAGGSSNLEPAGPADHTKPSLHLEKSRSAKGKANVVPSTASAGDAQPADPSPAVFTVELLFETVPGCDTTSCVRVRNPRTGGNRTSRLLKRIVAGRRQHRRNGNSSDNNDAARLARQLSPASDGVSSSARTATTSLQGTPPHAHQLAMTPEVVDAAADPPVDDGLWREVPADPMEHPELDECYLKPQLCVGFRHDPDGFSFRMVATFEVPAWRGVVAHDNLYVSFDCAAPDSKAVHLEGAAVEGTEKEAVKSSSARTKEWGQEGKVQLSAWVGKLDGTVHHRSSYTDTADRPAHYIKRMVDNNFEVQSEVLRNRVAFRATHMPALLHNLEPAPARGAREWAGAFKNAALAYSGNYRFNFYKGFRDYEMRMKRDVYVTSGTEVWKKANQAFLKRLKINHSFAELPSSNSEISWNLSMGGNEEEQARPFVREAERGEERRWFLRHAPDADVEYGIPVKTLQRMVQDERLRDDEYSVDRVLAAEVLEIERQGMQGPLNGQSPAEQVREIKQKVREIKQQVFTASRMKGRLNRPPKTWTQQPPADALAPQHNSTHSTAYVLLLLLLICFVVGFSLFTDR